MPGGDREVQGQNFGVTRAVPGRFDVTKLEPMLAEIHERLAGGVIEQLPYAEVVRRYDGPEMSFYLDPPYCGCERDDGDGFARNDFKRLADQLAGIAGRFVPSINATPGAREAFGRFDVEEVETSWTIGAAAGAKTKVTKPIVGNRRPHGCGYRATDLRVSPRRGGPDRP